MLKTLKKYIKRKFYNSLLLKKINILLKHSFENSYLQKKTLSKNLIEFEIQGFSQFGEDGLIRYLTDNLNISKKVFVELGVENYEEANTRMLLEYNWTGLVVEGNKEYCEHILEQEYVYKNSLKCENSFITKENINNVIKKNNIFGQIGLLSIDLDGNDYWIWDEINIIDPDIVIIEYNSRFGDNSVTIPYEPLFERGKKLHKVYYGASLKALIKLGKIRGYSIICTNSNGNNAFFVKNSLLNEKVKASQFKQSFNLKSFKETTDDENIDLMKFPITHV